MRKPQMTVISHASGQATELLEYTIISKKDRRGAKKNVYCFKIFNFPENDYSDVDNT